MCKKHANLQIKDYSRRTLLSSLLVGSISSFAGFYTSSVFAQSSKIQNFPFERNNNFNQDQYSIEFTVKNKSPEDNLENRILNDITPARSSNYYRVLNNKSNQNPQPNNRFKIINLAGNVIINGRPALIGSQVNAGSVIETADNSYIVYRFFDEAVKLYPNSRITHGNHPNKWGELYGAMTVSVKNRDIPRKIYLPNSTILLNGSGIHINTFYQLYGRNSEIIYGEYICTCYGQAIIQRPTNPNNYVKIDSQHHNFPYISTPAYYLATNQVIGHNDREVIELANLLS